MIGLRGFGELHLSMDLHCLNRFLYESKNSAKKIDIKSLRKAGIKIKFNEYILLLEAINLSSQISFLLIMTAQEASFSMSF